MHVLFAFRGRVYAVQVVRNLSGLLKIVNVGQKAALDELVMSWVKNDSINKPCIQVKLLYEHLLFFMNVNYKIITN